MRLEELKLRVNYSLIIGFPLYIDIYFIFENNFDYLIIFLFIIIIVFIIVI